MIWKSLWLPLALLAVLTISAACGQRESTSPGVMVELNPFISSASKGGEVAIEVRVDPNGRGISGGEINLAFDASAMAILSVVPGQLYGDDPLEGVKSIDNENGRLIYALARVGPTSVPSEVGIFAKIAFAIHSQAAEGRHEITLTEVGLADEKFEEVQGITLRSATVTI